MGFYGIPIPVWRKLDMFKEIRVHSVECVERQELCSFSENTLFVRIGILNVDNCTFCLSASESIVHLFWHCNITQSILQSLAVWITESTGITFSLSYPTVILGLSNNICNNYSTINFIILAAKYYIYKCKMEGCTISFSCLQNYLKHTYNIEKLAINKQDKSRHEAEWRDFKYLFI